MAENNGPIAVPKELPAEVVHIYEPVKFLGQGGFGMVVLAKSKKEKTQLHAIKVVGSKDATRKEIGYANREINILTEVDHPNIMRLVQHWEPAADSHRNCVAVMALSYAAGPTLQFLVNLGGRLSLPFARVVCAQLVDAVSYLHGRAVVHRDIKPDNVIVTGASKDDDEVYDDIIKDPYWNQLRQRWKVTLIDFGFARALTPEDVKKRPPKMPTSNDVRTMLDSSTPSSRSLSRSMSRDLNRQMSTVGTRKYAAPEVTRKILDISIHDASQLSSIDITKTLSEHVSYYGLMADAFSVGCVIKCCITGVPPDQDVDEMIALSNTPLVILCRVLCSMCVSAKDQKGEASKERKVKYRAIKDIPGEVARTIRGLTRMDAQQRISVRTARLYPWIDDVLENHMSTVTQSIDFLSFTTKDGIVEKEDGKEAE